MALSRGKQVAIPPNYIGSGDHCGASDEASDTTIAMAGHYSNDDTTEVAFSVCENQSEATFGLKLSVYEDAVKDDDQGHTWAEVAEQAQRKHALLIERAQAGLSFRGVTKIHIDSDSTLMQFLVGPSFVSHHDTTDVAVQKHIILVLQAHTLFEDCLHVGRRQIGQKAIGLSPESKGSFKAVYCRFLELVEEFDVMRYLILKLIKTALRTLDSIMSLDDRLEERRLTRADALRAVQQAKTIEHDLYTKFARMVQPVASEPAALKPWLLQLWCDIEVPKIGQETRAEQESSVNDTSGFVEQSSKRNRQDTEVQEEDMRRKLHKMDLEDADVGDS